MVVHVVPRLLHQHCVIVTLQKHLCNGWQPLVLKIRQLEAPHIQIEALEVEGADSSLRLRSSLSHMLGDRIWKKPGGRQGGEPISLFKAIAEVFYMLLVCVKNFKK